MSGPAAVWYGNFVTKHPIRLREPYVHVQSLKFEMNSVTDLQMTLKEVKMIPEGMLKIPEGMQMIPEGMLQEKKYKTVDASQQLLNVSVMTSVMKSQARTIDGKIVNRRKF